MLLALLWRLCLPADVGDLSDVGVQGLASLEGVLQLEISGCAYSRRAVALHRGSRVPSHSPLLPRLYTECPDDGEAVRMRSGPQPECSSGMRISSDECMVMWVMLWLQIEGCCILFSHSPRSEHFKT